MKNLKSLGKTLSKQEQQTISGGTCGVYDSQLGAWVYGMSMQDAQDLYNEDPVITGWCCASCKGVA